MNPENPKSRWAGSGSDFLHPNSTYAFGGNFDLSSCHGGKVDNMGGLLGKTIVHDDFDRTPVAQVGYFDAGPGW
jgi:hypothetical protein